MREPFEKRKGNKLEVLMCLTSDKHSLCLCVSLGMWVQTAVRTLCHFSQFVGFYSSSLSKQDRLREIGVRASHSLVSG